MKSWVLPDGRINWEYISNVYGDQEVTVANCGARDFSDQERETMRMDDAVEEIVGAPGGSAPPILPYVKDWHLVLQSASLENPDDRIPYEVPDIFKDDCMSRQYLLRHLVVLQHLTSYIPKG